MQKISIPAIAFFLRRQNSVGLPISLTYIDLAWKANPNCISFFFLEPVNRQFGKNKDINLTAILAENFPIHAKINYRKFASIREKASACHASQGGDNQSGYILTWIMRFFSAVEIYMQAYPEKFDGKIDNDLFSGI